MKKKTFISLVKERKSSWQTKLVFFIEFQLSQVLYNYEGRYISSQEATFSKKISLVTIDSKAPLHALLRI